MDCRRVLWTQRVVRALLVSGLAPTAALGPVVSGQGAQVFHAGVDMVAVTVSVTDGHRRLVGGLTKDDFLVFEDGSPQAVAAFTTDRLPLSLGILLDVSDSMSGARLADARLALETFLGTLLRPEDEVFLTAFNHKPQPLVGWTSEPRRLSGRFDAVRPYGGTALYDAMIATAPEFTRRRHQRAALLVISDGADTASDVSLVRTVSTLRRMDPFVYAVAIDSSSRMPINTRVNPEALRALTDPTGGYTEIIHESAELAAATARIAEELNAQYTIGYTPAHPPDGKYHIIRVQVPGKQYLVRARRGYVSTFRPRGAR